LPKNLRTDLISHAKYLYRAHYTCSGEPYTTAQPVGAYEKIDLSSGYGNVTCRNRKQEQCYPDGTYDNYYNERCDYGIVAFDEGETKTAPGFALKVNSITQAGVEIELTSTD